jgi:prepilin-type N-terminal cleavage/methylation domain-containing protein
MNKRRQRAALMGLGSTQNSQRGFTLPEVLVAMGILAAAAVVFLAGMTTSSKSVMISQKDVAAESLAKSELEYVKSCYYYSANVTWSYQLPSTYPPWDPTHALPDGYDGYTVNVTGEYVEITPGLTYDAGIQKITIVTGPNGAPPFTLVGYKAAP